MAKKKNSKANKKLRERHCYSCINCTYIGEGDYMCDECGEPKTVISEYEPTDDFNACQGEKWEENW